MKKFLSLLMTIVMVFTMMSMTAFATSGSITIQADKTSAAVGDTVNYTVYMSGSDIWNLEFSYAIPSGLELVNVSIDSAFDSTTGFTATAVNSNASFVYSMGALNAGYTGTAAVAHITCKVVGTGDLTVSVSGGLFTDENGNTVSVGGGSATVSVTAPHECAPIAVEEVAATCTEDGVKAHYACECGKLYFDAEGTKEVAKSDLVIPATGHKFGEWEVVKEATCTEDGEAVRECACGETETKAIPATGHKFGEWEVVKEATCTEDGEAVRECACGETETKAIPATGHKFGEWEVVKEATCTEDGAQTRKCACGETEIEVIKAEGHKYDWVVDKKATATEDGLKHQECSVCGDKTNNTVIPATGEELDDVPQTNDITPYYMMGVVAMVALAGVVFKRRNAR